ncbi:MAG TPA: S-adenosylmethionine:tRNA ribosyltransferase-isomerase [Acidimicrobiia bacterium]
MSIAPLTLHTGVSSLEAGEDPFPEWFDVPEPTAALVNHTHRRGGRVVAVGTTVVRALESTADSRGVSHPGRSWTDLVILRDHRMRVVDGLITGWHEPASTHLDLLEALGGREMLSQSYETALDTGYLWHEFGDSHLILPG